MMGRSNVGKSRLINSMLGAKYAISSKAPGKTDKLHFFRNNVINLTLVDCPGYGYAQVNNAERENWKKLMQTYFKKNNLYYLSSLTYTLACTEFFFW